MSAVERKYTEEVYNELVAMIQDIQENDVCWIKDKLEDAVRYFKSWIGELNIEHYLDNVSEYHREVLDQHDTTVEELNKIFDEVGYLDFTYRDKVENLYDGLCDHRRAIEALSSAFGAGGSLISPSRMQICAGQINALLASGSERIDETFEEVLRKREEEVVWDAFKELIGDVLSYAGSICKFIGCISTGNIVGAILALWGVIDKLIATTEDMGAIAAIIYGNVHASDNELNTRYYGLTAAEEAKDINGIVDYAEANDLPDWTVATLRFADAVIGGYNLIDDITSTAETYSDIINGAKKEYENLSGIEKFKEVLKYCFLGGNGFKSISASDVWKRRGSEISLISTIYKYIDEMSDTPWYNGSQTKTPWEAFFNAFFGNNRILKRPKDLFDFISKVYGIPGCIFGEEDKDIFDIIEDIVNANAAPQVQPEERMYYDIESGTWTQRKVSLAEKLAETVESVLNGRQEVASSGVGHGGGGASW